MDKVIGMSIFFIPVLTGLAWMGLTAEIGWGAFAVGASLGLLVWRLGQASNRKPFRSTRALRLIWLGGRVFAVFLWELVIANLEQLRIVLAPRIDIRPGWIRYRSELETPGMQALLGVMITLTPGSLTYEESPGEDGSFGISLHVLDLRDEEQVVERIRTRFEAPLRAMETS